MNVAVRRRKRPEGNVSREQTPAREPFVFAPHPGAQTRYFTAEADFVLAGGGAGGGKTMCLLMDGLRDVDEPGYEFAMFRKTLVMHKMGGGLRRESQKFYPRLGATFNKTEMLWEFPSGAQGKFYGCDDPSKYDGLQCAVLLIDQLEQLSAEEFWHLQSRVRTPSGVKTRIRATCNPEPGWLELLLKSGGYVGADGLPVAEMDGVVRWFVRNPETDEIVWRDRAEDFGPVDDEGIVTEGEWADMLPTSFTFVRFPLDQNPSVSKKYRARLQNMMMAERRKKLEGNWNQFSGGGTVYRAEWWGLKDGVWSESRNVLKALPDEEIGFCLAVDVGWSADGDWTSIVLMGQGPSGWLWCDMVKFRAREPATFAAIKMASEAIGKAVPIVLPKDPGKAGLDQVGWQLELGRQGHVVHMLPDDGKAGDKVARHRFLSPQAETGHLKIVPDWRPLRAVSLWLTSQESAPGKPVEVTTVDEWAREGVECLHALGPDCAHEVTDVTDAVCRGHRFLTSADPAGAARVAAALTDPSTWSRPDDPRAVAARAAQSEWARVRVGAAGGAPDPGDFLSGSRRGARFAG